MDDYRATKKAAQKKRLNKLKYHAKAKKKALGDTTAAPTGQLKLQQAPSQQTRGPAAEEKRIDSDEEEEEIEAASIFRKRVIIDNTYRYNEKAADAEVEDKYDTFEKLSILLQDVGGSSAYALKPWEKEWDWEAYPWLSKKKKAAKTKEGEAASAASDVFSIDLTGLSHTLRTLSVQERLKTDLSVMEPEMKKGTYKEEVIPLSKREVAYLQQPKLPEGPVATVDVPAAAATKPKPHEAQPVPSTLPESAPAPQVQSEQVTPSIPEKKKAEIVDIDSLLAFKSATTTAPRANQKRDTRPVAARSSSRDDDILDELLGLTGDVGTTIEEKKRLPQHTQRPVEPTTTTTTTKPTPVAPPAPKKKKEEEDLDEWLSTL